MDDTSIHLQIASINSNAMNHKYIFLVEGVGAEVTMSRQRMIFSP